MSEYIDSTRIGAITIDGNSTAYASGQNPTGTSTNIVIDVRGMGTAAIQTITTSSLAYKVYVSYNGGTTFAPVVSRNSAGAETAADTAITASATVVDYVMVLGATHIRVTRTAGSGTVAYAGHPDPEWYSASTQAQVVNTFGSIREVAVTFSLPAATVTANDVIADSQIMATVVSADNANGYLVGWQLLDEDDNTAGDYEMYLLSANVSLGTEDAAISITDANARNIMHVIKVDDTDWVDLIGSKIATSGASKNGGPWPITPVSGSDDIYIALVSRSATTHTASGMTGRFWFQDAR